MTESIEQSAAIEKKVIRKEKRSFLTWVLVFFILFIALVTTWIWNLNPDQKDLYLRYVGIENNGNYIETIERIPEYQKPTPSALAVPASPAQIIETNEPIIEETINHVPDTYAEPEQVIIPQVQILTVDNNKPSDIEPIQKIGLATPEQQSTINMQLQNLMLEIHELRQDLRQNQQDQIMLHQANLARQQLDLHTRLRWVLMPSNNWMHLYIYWQDIASLPMLTDEQRQQAEKKAEIARKYMQAILEWRKQMSLMIHEIQSIRDIPDQPLMLMNDNPWLAWLSGHFRISHAQPKNNKALNHLQNLIQEMLLLGHGQWPDEQRWTDIYRQIIRLFPEKVHISTLKFDNPAQDRQAMKALAMRWLGQK